ncbi:MAG: OmpA family protein [Myxococcales bacterium]|nr:OmpA family protein [Myxococcales bacterium]
MRRPLRALTLTLFTALSLAGPSAAHADEVWLLGLEADAMVPLSRPQRDWFRPGAAGSVSLYRSFHRTFLLGARVRGGLLFDGPAPSDPTLADPGIGSLGTFTLGFRLRPLARRDDPRRGVGLFVEAHGGAAVTGGLTRAALDVGVGWGFEVGRTRLAPVARYVRVFQTANQLEDRDAQLLLVGLEVTLLDRARGEPPPLVEQEIPAPSDRDGDGIPDELDACPDEPEDLDGFEDEDGCPDLDNDGDGILDRDDRCPSQPEDFDGFEDEDGCPDPDNDGDGIPDERDACPNEPETVNGVEDEDGCPDEGLIRMIDDRIVLEERVLFDFERARVKSAARPILEAIANLVQQHPEWALMRIAGHADVRGDEDFNRRLSERRAHNVMRALIAAGVAADRLESRGHGSSRPRDRRMTEEAHQRNRRVEFIIVARRPHDAPADAPLVRSPHADDDDAAVGDTDASLD